MECLGQEFLFWRGQYLQYKQPTQMIRGCLRPGRDGCWEFRVRQLFQCPYHYNPVIYLKLFLFSRCLRYPPPLPVFFSSSDEAQVGEPAAVRRLGNQSARIRWHSAAPGQSSRGVCWKRFQRRTGEWTATSTRRVFFFFLCSRLQLLFESLSNTDVCTPTALFWC